MCDRCQRVPVFGMYVGECPRNIGETDAAGYPGILIDVLRIIVVNEIVAERLCKHRPCNYCKTHADSDECPARRQLTSSSYLAHNCDCESPNGKIMTDGDGGPSLAFSCACLPLISRIFFRRSKYNCPTAARMLVVVRNSNQFDSRKGYLRSRPVYSTD